MNNDTQLEKLRVELEDAWERMMLVDDDRQEGEFTQKEASEAWEKNLDTTYDQLERMVRKKVIVKRRGRHNGKPCMWYRVVEEEESTDIVELNS